MWLYLIKGLFQQKKLFSALLWSEHDVDPDWCAVSFQSYVEENSEVFPMEIGSDYTQEQKNQMTLFLVSINSNLIMNKYSLFNLRSRQALISMHSSFWSILLKSLCNGVARTLKKLGTPKGDYWIKQ